MTVRRVVPDIRTTAMDDCKGFYGLLGMEEAMDLGWVVTMASPSNPTAQVILFDEAETEPVQPDLSIEVEDVDAVYAAVTGSGAEIVRTIRDEPWGVRRFFAVDPNGRVVNVVSHKSS